MYPVEGMVIAMRNFKTKLNKGAILAIVSKMK